MKFRYSFCGIGVAGLLAAGLVFSTGAGFGQAIYTSGHADIGVGYSGGNFEPHWHLHAGAVVDGTPIAADEEYDPDDLRARTSAMRSSPTGLNAGIGVADGTTIYVAGSSSYQPNLGFGVEELDPLDWIGDITLTLTGWTLPSASADFALYTTNLADTLVVDIVFSTHDPASTALNNSFTMTPGDHLHFQWGFTEVGIYDFEFTWSGTHATDGFISTTETYSVQAIPEPAAGLLAALGLGLAMLRHRRRS